MFMRKSTLLILGIFFSIGLFAQQPGYTVKPLESNTQNPEFCAVPYGTGLLLTTSRKRGFFSRVFDKKTGKTFYDLYEVPTLKGPDAKKGKFLKGKVNTRYNEGPATFSRDFKTLYFSRSSYISGKLTRSATSGKANLKIMTATRQGKKYKEVKSLSFNSDEYSCTHPTVTKDGKTMFFTSNQPGGYGGYDLYMVAMTDSGKWGKPVNLGRNVNSPKDELFPYIHPSGILFFSSNGHKGVGGLDLFAADQVNGKWRSPVNMGTSINSASDDFGIVWKKNKPAGYFSSDRSGNDDIYSFSRDFPINGVVTQKGTGKPLADAAIIITTTNGKETKIQTDADGKFTYAADLNRDYKLDANMEFHEGITNRISTKGLSPVGSLDLKIELERLFSLAGKVQSDPAGQAIKGASVRLIQGPSERRKLTDDKGNHVWKLEAETDYVVVVQKDGFLPVITEVSTKGKEGAEIPLNTRMKPGSGVLVEGTVLDKKTREPIDAMFLRATEELSGNEVRSTISNTYGRFWMVLDTTANFSIICSKLGYYTDREDVPAKDQKLADTTIVVELIPMKKSEGQMVKEILYDYNKSDIRIMASKELNEVAYFLIDNPTAKVELGAHTDCRGGNNYNQKLSQSRAEAAVNYILKKGIDKSRISAKGYGESTLKNGCKDSVECTDEQHQENRRCEIILRDDTGTK